MFFNYDEYPRSVVTPNSSHGNEHGLMGLSLGGPTGTAQIAEKALGRLPTGWVTTLSSNQSHSF